MAGEFKLWQFISFDIYNCTEANWSISKILHWWGLLKRLLPWKISLWCCRGKQYIASFCLQASNGVEVLLYIFPMDLSQLKHPASNTR